MDFTLQSDASSTVPRELTGPLPRKTVLTGIGVQAIVVTAVMLLMPFVFLVAIGIGDMKEFKNKDALRSGSSEVAGEVIETRKSVLHYTFSVNGTMYSGKALLPSGLSPTPRHFDLIPIRYLPENPAVNHPAAWEWSAWQNWPALVIPFLFYVPGIAMIWDLKTRKRVLENGIPAVGTITGCSRAKYGYRATFEFHTQDGTMATGGGGYDTPQETGTRIWVVYLKENPQRNGPYPCLSYRVVD